MRSSPLERVQQIKTKSVLSRHEDGKVPKYVGTSTMNCPHSAEMNQIDLLRHKNSESGDVVS